jgi:hypothetical protein
LWQPGDCGLEMPVGTCRGSGETGGLADGRLFVRLGGESAGSAWCVRGQCRRPTVRSVAACCVVRGA